MSERVGSSPNYPDYGMRSLDYFYGGQERHDQRKAYEERGLIPTNNLSLYIVDEPEADIGPGIPNHIDYRQRPFGVVIEQLRLSQPELWEEAKRTAAEHTAIMTAFSDLLRTGQKDVARQLEVMADEAYWAKGAVYDKVIRAIAPALEAEGIDPLDVCK